MRDPRSSRLRLLLEEAWELPLPQRAAWLHEACAGDEELLQRARALLEAEDEIPDGFLATPIQAPEQDGPRSAGEISPGERLGPWRLERELGRGGMGTVWLAVRDDEAFERRVAIKFLRAALFDREMGLRFQRECALQASLDHPGIARMIDSGVASGGRPFLVLEYVDGRPLDRWCAEQELTIDARLKLFAKVCDAVHHAHRMLIVHRDIKPGNVLVTGEGKPKLLDFGIAKLLQPEEDAAWTALTREEQRLFTPSYASPEQLRGETIGIGSDVYSLGVLLYELLVGAPPFDFDGCGWAEMLRIMEEEDPVPPSAMGERSASKVLRGDLDAILLTALRKEPERRYGSVEAFADDVRRHLARLPVRARPDTISYRSSRFLRRNRVGAAAAAAGLIALCAGFASTYVQYREAESARALAVDRAEELSRLSEELATESRRAAQRFDDVRRFATDLVFDVHDLLVPVEGSIVAQERILAIGAEHLASLEVDAESDLGLRRELAEAWLQLGVAQGSVLSSNVGKMRESGESFLHALELARKLRAEAAIDPVHIARLHLNAAVQLADTRELQGDASASRALLDEALASAHLLADAEDATRGDLDIASTVYDRLAWRATSRGELDDARAHMADLRAIQARSDGQGGAGFQPDARAALTAWRSADIERMAKDHLAALELDTSALERLDGLQYRSPGPEFQRLWRIARTQVGIDLIALKRGAEALPYIEAVVEELEELVELQPGDAHARLDRAIAWGALALGQEVVESLHEATETALFARDLAAELAGEDGSNEEYSQLLLVKSVDASRIAARAALPGDALDALGGMVSELERRERKHPDWPRVGALCANLGENLARILEQRASMNGSWRELAEKGEELLLHAASVARADDPAPALRLGAARLRALLD